MARVVQFGTLNNCGMAILENFPGIYQAPIRDDLDTTELEQDIKRMVQECRAGLVVAVLGQNQFKVVGPALERCGFKLTNTFRNRIHGWPNYFYTHDVVEEQVKERDGIFA